LIYNGSDLDRALADFNESIRLAPKDAVNYQHRGTCYFLRREFDHAIADYTESIRLAPHNFNLYEFRANAYEKKGNRAKAAADRRTFERLKKGGR
jgi:tetratricopeptide (TPR) repeat protein